MGFEFPKIFDVHMQYEGWKKKLCHNAITLRYMSIVKIFNKEILCKLKYILFRSILYVALVLMSRAFFYYKWHIDIGLHLSAQAS